jgi:hypothetical protein
MKKVVLASLLVAVLMAATPAAAFHTELERYNAALSEICSTGITRDLRNLFEVSVEALDAAKEGAAGHQSRFGWPILPELAIVNCSIGSDGGGGE